MFKFIESKLSGCFEIRSRLFQDHRGRFVKTFHREMFLENGLNSRWVEEYYTISGQGVLRGLHFQVPPHDHAKLVYCSSGEVVDAVVDLRQGSPMFGRSDVFCLSAERANMLYIPRGMAHGFCTVSDSATMHYLVESVYVPESDKGILWDSADIVWPVKAPILSERDAGFPPLAEFETPFVLPVKQ